MENNLASGIMENTFFVRIDNKDHFEEISNLYGIVPAIKSRIDGQSNTYAVFMTTSPLDDARMSYAVQGCLKKLFEHSGKNLSQFKKELKLEYDALNDLRAGIAISSATEDRLDIAYLLEVTCFHINNEAKNNNGAVAVRGFLKAINIQEIDSHPFIEITKRSMNPQEEITNSSDPLIYIIDTGYEFVKIYFAINSHGMVRQLNGERIFPEKTVNNATDPSWDEREINSLIADPSACQLLADLCSGNRRLSMYEINGIAKSLCNVQGAQTILKERMELSGDYESIQLTLMGRLMSRYRRMGYDQNELACKSFCGLVVECRQNNEIKFGHITDLLRQPSNKIITLRNRRIGNQSITAIREQMQEQFNTDLNSDDVGITVYKSFVGAGKTSLYLAHIPDFIAEDKTVLIAFPTHVAKNDVFGRLSQFLDAESIEDKLINVPQVPNIEHEFDALIKSYYANGEYKRARRLMEDRLNEIIGASNGELNDERQQLERYLQVTDSLRDQDYTQGKIVFTTHDRLFSLGHIEPDVVIVDEDIVFAMLKQHQVEREEIIRLKGLIEGNMQSRYKQRVIQRIDTILRASKNQLGSLERFEPQSEKKEVLKIINDSQVGSISSRTVDHLFIASEYVNTLWIRENRATIPVINFVSKRELPAFACKVFVMSATADQEIYEQLFRADKVRFLEFDLPRLRARISMIHDYSFSRTSIENMEEREQLWEKTAFVRFIRDYRLNPISRSLEQRYQPKQPLIVTFSEYEEFFNTQGFDTTLHYGSVTSVNEHEGKNVAVFGTPNIPSFAYALYVNALYPNDKLESVPEYSRQLVSNSGYRFYFRTADHEKFRKIHMWMIESEMIQALGRVRPIDNECIIRIYSNYPPGCLDITFLNNK
ncbi:ATP-binding protein [Paenibacillus tianjinensis]|uniref:Type III restriction enzyme, res subunit n=1 Tax=Paenibacillus tianjinensis TaxID=2810347 RepID=A0ABX7LDG7_9BACL|nr:hypothetical protein [Paenibacillus tianjinensis]QSF45286.1 hypothetical protein JRJ22_00985 [Paenibacillus tianjinensis]